MRNSFLIFSALFLFVLGCLASEDGGEYTRIVNGTIRSFDQLPSSATIMVVRLNSSHDGTYEVIARNVSNGSFSVLVPENSFLIVENAAGQRILAIPANESFESVDIAFSEPYTLRGVVSPNAILFLYQKGVLLHKTLADAQGVFFLAPVQAGTYDLVGISPSENLTKMIHTYQTGGSQSWGESTETPVRFAAAYNDTLRLRYDDTPVAPFTWDKGYAVFGYIPVGNATLEVTRDNQTVFKVVTVPPEGGIVE